MNNIGFGSGQHYRYHETEIITKEYCECLYGYKLITCRKCSDSLGNTSSNIQCEEINFNRKVEKDKIS